MMLEWSVEQPTEITTTAIDLEFLPTDTNVDRGVQNLEFVVQQMHTALTALTSCEANDIVANSRKNPLEAWRRLQKRCDPTTGGRKRNLLRTIILFWTVLSCGTASGDRTLGVLRVSLRKEDEGQVGRRDVETAGNGQTGATCCERTGPHSILHVISCWFHQRSWFSQNHFEMRQ